MKKRFLFLLIVSVALLFNVSCGDDEEGGGETSVNTRCNSNIDCTRDSYCDLENPKQDAELGTLVYYCKKRQLCATQADCSIGWKCKVSEGFCITNKEASEILCSSDTDCKDPLYPKCNLATGECETVGGGDISDSGDSGDTEIPDSPDSTDSGDSDTSDDDSDTGDSSSDTGSDNDTDADTSAEESVGKTVMTEDFEDGGTNWTIVPAAEETPCWEIGAPTSGPEAANGGTNVAATNLAGNYLGNCKDLLYYNTTISLPSSGKPEITFYAWVDLIGNGYSPYDYVEVLVKKSEGTWELTDTGVPLVADTPSALSALDNHKTKITKQLGTKYYKFTGDLSAFKGQSVDIGFRFTSDGSDEAAGFYLDDVAVSY